MNDRGVVLLGALVGAALGAGAGFLMFTERGRRLRAQAQPELEALVREAMKLGTVVGDLQRPAGPRPVTRGRASS